MADLSQFLNKGNLNKFGGGGIDDIIALGVVNGTNAVISVLPTLGNNPPSSITVTSTFVIKDVNGATVLASGVIPILGGESSNKGTLIAFTGLPALTVDKPVAIYSETATSEIVVNF